MPYRGKIRIAVIDDDEDDFILIQDCIRYAEGNLTVDWYNNYEEAFPHIVSKAYDLYFIDYFLGAKTGIELLQEARKLHIDRPLVLLTGVGNRDIDILAMKCGATDYLVKADLTTEKVERCIRYSLQRTLFLEELKASEKKYYTLFEGSKDAVFIANKDLVFKEINISTQQLLEIKKEDTADLSLYDFIEGDNTISQLKKLIATYGKIEDIEIKLCKENHESKICLLSLHVLEQNDEPVIHGIIHDISKLKKAEQDRILTEKMQANDRLLRVLAHEIRNPLCNIILSTEMLIPEIAEDNQVDLLKIMDRNAHRINDIIAELLGLTNPGELVLEKISLQDILEEALNRAEDRIALQKIQVEKNYEAHPYLINGDKKKLVMAFTNIFINAVEAMEAGKGKLSVEIFTDGITATAGIKDNGRGVPKEYLSKLFEPLFTLKQKGMGLGLTATYSIIQAHNAKMQVESTEGEGTNFYICFEVINNLLPVGY